MNHLNRRLAAIGLALALPLAVGGCGINTIPTKEETAKAKWADVQNYYQRRSDLIPNLVAVVQANAAQERNVLVEVTEARASATQVKVDASTITDPAAFQAYQQSQDRLSGALGRLMVVSEQYPELKSNESFRTLMDQIEGSENRISTARHDYNVAVQDYNTALRVFPTTIWAHTIQSGQHPMQLFTASAASQSAPTVKIDTGAPVAPPTK